MAEAGEDDSEPEVFEITDFTTASEWERFIARVEEIIHEWHLDNTADQGTTVQGKAGKMSVAGLTAKYRRISSNEDDIRTEKLSFADFRFALAYHYLAGFDLKSTQGNKNKEMPKALQELSNLESDYPPRAHHLCRWHGLREFMILYPSTSGEAITSESRAQLLWSSVAIALSNVKCEIPVFIQVQQKWRKLYYGVGISAGFRTSYEMAHLKSTPSQCNHISGLVDIFKAKLACPLRSIPPVTISVRFLYIIRDWAEDDWPQEPPDFQSAFGEEVGLSNLIEIPYGPLQDPVCDLHFAATWPCLSEEVIVDEAEYSDLDPLMAPKWTLRARVVERCPTLTYEHLKGFLQLCKTPESTAQIVRALSTDDSDLDPPMDIAQALDRLTEPVPVLSQSLSSAVTKAKSRVIKSRLSESPLPEDLLNQTLQLLFPDACLSSNLAQKCQKELAKEQEQIERLMSSSKSKYRSLKSAPEKSLTYMLALCLCIVYHGYGGVKAVVHLWHEFVLEMRYRYENNIIIPSFRHQHQIIDIQQTTYCINKHSSLTQFHEEELNDDWLSSGAPNLNHCLLHQKLQMLNCCIERRKQFLEDQDVDQSKLAESKLSASRNRSQSNISNISSTSKSYSDSEDEFFEALEEQDLHLERKSKVVKKDEPNGDKDIKMLPREGVLERTEMKLLETGETLCIPITQEPPPMTEDMLEEQAEIFAKLGSTEEGTRVRAEMQSASLLSDVEAFKAANPGCILDDFVRWYSPNDWIPSPETKEERLEMRSIIQQMAKDRANIPPMVRLQTVSDDTVDIINLQPTDGWDIEEDLEITEDEIHSVVDEVDSIKGDDDSQKRNKPWRSEGHLSLRMRIPGNIWQEVWARARPVPIRRQKRLFDDTKEAEKVLHFLSSLCPADIALHLFPALIHESIRRLKKEDSSSQVTSLLDQITRNASRLINASPEDLEFIEEIIRQLHAAELSIARTQSLLSKFDAAYSESDHRQEIEKFILKLLNQPEVPIEGGAKGVIGKKIVQMLSKYDKNRESTSKKNLPIPAGREYILRTTVPKPSVSSRPSPQRMFAAITPEDFRLSGAFTIDTNFI